ncbi:uncharacterized protein LOC143065412 [Mytilus galloprovincialis]|uniref:Prokineticin domain-containing protein n=1 Tax=Mytilus galloprovincialis TaxID=29158 RepID=A0A8B6DCY7_MYTGA|nr:Hypothetical predicted protein [Mytilus galloprovincialis]
MDYHFIITLMVIVIAAKVEGAAIQHDQTCTLSSECPTGSCCRHSNGSLLIYSGVFDHIGPYNPQSAGNCVPLLAQYNEQCGETCACDETEGLTCFRSFLADNTIAPFRCQDKSYVDRETDKFMDCFQNPKCQLPL